MLTIEVKLNGQIIAEASARNLSELADTSDYFVCWNEAQCSASGIENDYGKFMIKGHRRRQSAWALVAKVVEGVLGAMIGSSSEKPDQASIWEQAGSDHK
jgi:hypothetical protein